MQFHLAAGLTVQTGADCLKSYLQCGSAHSNG
nr:MAG TPA: hypothetical protein [Bacteriophage sp.]